jgi:hypothetical protein
MKRTGVWLVLLAAFVASPQITFAQGEDEQERLEVEYKKKMDKEFTKKLPWVHTFDAAKSQAAKENKLILGYFSRSYAQCPPCNHLEGGALLSDWWVALAKDYVPYLNITAQLKEKPDQDLLEAKGGDGFPYMIFMDSSGAVLTDRIWPEGEEDVKTAYADAMTKKAAIDALRAAVEKNANDPVARANLALKLALHRVTDTSDADLDALAKTPGLDAAILGEYKVHQVRKSIMNAQKTAMESAKSQEEFMANIESAMYGLAKSGVTIPSSDELANMFFFAGFEGALKAKDKAVAKTMLTGIEEFLKVIVGKDESVKPRAEEFLADVKHRLADLEAGVEHTPGHEHGKENEHEGGGEKK